MGATEQQHTITIKTIYFSRIILIKESKLLSLV